jgi:hypothetical protein
MPANVRNFYIVGNIDGRKTQLAGGPASKDGGFTLSVFIRSNGLVAAGVTIYGKADKDGMLTIECVPSGDELVTTSGNGFAVGANR